MIWSTQGSYQMKQQEKFTLVKTRTKCILPSRSCRHYDFITLFLRWFKNLERAHQFFINTHQCTGIIEFTTVVGGRKYRDKLSFVKEFISILHNLSQQEIYLRTQRREINEKHERWEKKIKNVSLFYLMGTTDKIQVMCC